MPTVFKYKSFRFFFFSNENDEPIHIHVEKDNFYAKIWLEPLKIAKNYGFSAKDINKILKIVEENIDLIKDSWNEFFSN